MRRRRKKLTRDSQAPLDWSTEHCLAGTTHDWTLHTPFCGRGWWMDGGSTGQRCGTSWQVRVDGQWERPSAINAPRAEVGRQRGAGFSPARQESRRYDSNIGTPMDRAKSSLIVANQSAHRLIGARRSNQPAPCHYPAFAFCARGYPSSILNHGSSWLRRPPRCVQSRVKLSEAGFRPSDFIRGSLPL